ncbi:TonB-dependent siderophore receptor [Acinetobacter venetianus]|uniref:FhuE receptor n=1 Tax=Acinetobacter venetianus TaxID=52133 RepID=A0A150HXQ6_9GAMM|nr:TonB-dependent siderophore receptor [Acinetobacter venetianus]KXZ71892.1 FhuE receptor precursor [Acinetobacter venetianus]
MHKHSSRQVFKTHPLVLAMAVLLPSFAYAESSTESTAQLPTIKIQAEAADLAITEGSQSYTSKSSNTATKLNLSLRETPQAVKVYTRDYLDDRNIDSFQDLMSNVTGVTVSRTDERQSYFARGFQLDYHLIDGMPSTSSLAEGDLDLGIYDRIEVVKGANGLNSGAGNPSMGLNLVRKRANAKEFTGNVNASGGSWNSYSSSADLSNSLNADGSLRGRIYVKHSDEDSFMDFYSRERNIVYGAIDYDVSDRTNLSFAATYQQLNRDGIRWGGLPAFYNDGTRTNFNRSLTVSSDWTYWNVDTKAVFANLKQNLFKDIDLNVAYSFQRNDKETALLYVAGKVDKVTNKSLGAVSVYSSDARTEENNIDMFISAPFTIANRKQEIILGGSWNKSELVSSRYGTIQGRDKGTNDLDIDDWSALNFSDINTNLLTPITNPNKLPGNMTTQMGYYVAGKFQVFDPLKIVAGARLSNWEYESEDKNGNRDFNDQFTPYFGVVYDFAQDHSFYASYTDIFKPQNRREQNGNYLDPIIGRNYETGIKSEWFDGQLNSALSIFRIEQTNFAEAIDGVFVKNAQGVDTSEQAYRGVDGVVSKGVELEVDGEINNNWAINFGIANFEAKDAKDKKVATNSARTTSNLFIKYKEDQWNAGLGVNYRGKTYTGTGANLIEQNEIFLLSAMLGYKVDQNISVQLNLDNLLDKKYYDGIGANSMNYGAPRNATLTLRYQF